MKILGMLSILLTSSSAFSAVLECKYNFIDYGTGRQVALTEKKTIKVTAPGQTQADIQMYVVAGRFNVLSSVISNESTSGKNDVRISSTDTLKKVTAQTSGNEMAELTTSDPSDIRNPQFVDTVFAVTCAVKLAP